MDRIRCHKYTRPRYQSELYHGESATNCPVVSVARRVAKSAWAPGWLPLQSCRTCPIHNRTAEIQKSQEQNTRWIFICRSWLAFFETLQFPGASHELCDIEPSNHPTIWLCPSFLQLISGICFEPYFCWETSFSTARLRPLTAFVLQNAVAPFGLRLLVGCSLTSAVDGRCKTLDAP